jgi:sigma-E factor negative regulatory protein RseA
MMDRTSGNEAALRLSALMDGELGANEADRVCADWVREADQRSTWHAYHVIGDVLRSEELGCATQDEAFLQRLRVRLEREPVVLAPLPLVEAPSTGAVPAEGAAMAAAGGAFAVSGRPSARRRLRWRVPVGAAAGVAAVAVAAFLMQQQGVDAPADGAALLAVNAEAPRAAASGLIAPTSGVEIAKVADAAKPLEVKAEAMATPDAAPGAASTTATAAVSEPLLTAEPTVLRNPMIDRYLSAHKGAAGAMALGPSANFIRSATYEAPAR